MEKSISRPIRVVNMSCTHQPDFVIVIYLRRAND
jgi:hypothetical protein